MMFALKVMFHIHLNCTFRYFNYRTTRFLAEEGFYKFHNWFDDRAWYPLGRIIGGTIYPGRNQTNYKRTVQVNNYKVINLFRVVRCFSNKCCMRFRREKSMSLIYSLPFLAVSAVMQSLLEHVSHCLPLFSLTRTDDHVRRPVPRPTFFPHHH